MAHVVCKYTNYFCQMGNDPGSLSCNGERCESCNRLDCSFGFLETTSRKVNYNGDNIAVEKYFYAIHNFGPGDPCAGYKYIDYLEIDGTVYVD